MDISDYSLLLPSGLLYYFAIVNVFQFDTQVLIYLEENNNLSSDISSFYESKGFYPAVVVNDFPLRGKSLFLHLRRRRWIHKQSGEYYNRDFSIVADGTRITQEFASFLKGNIG